MKATRFVPTEYWPTSPRSGNEGQLVFRMTNLILRGSSAHPYAEVYGGSLDLNENIDVGAVTGTVTTVANNTGIVGVGTAFVTELHHGQFLEIYKAGSAVTIPVVVDDIIDDTHFTVFRPPAASLAGASAFIFPVMVEMNKKRATLLRGNAVEADLGNIFAVGAGTLRRNGAVLPGTSLVATRTPQVALLNSTTGNYNVFPLGLATPATLAAADGPAGTKNMQGGVYSLRAAEARLETRGYGNPSPKAEVTLTAGNVIRATVPAASANTTAWVFFGTLFTQGGGINGPWYRIELPVTFVPIGAGAGEIPAAGGTYDIEYNDAEITANDLLSFNNSPPPNAEFVAYMAGTPVWISCSGPGDTSPGPMIAAGKPRNIEAVPPVQYVSTSPPDTIVGFHIGVQGRLYLACTGSLQIAVATQATDPRIPAFAVRPFWRSGFPNPETLISIGDNLIGMTLNGLARSISEGDEGSEEYNFETAVEELTRAMTPGHCLLKIDPKNNAAVLFHSGHSLNADGWWTTRALLYSLRETKWIGDILLSSPTGDMIVSSAATINGQLEFLCGGRQNDNTTVVRTYRWDDARAATPVTYSICWQLTDDGIEDRPKAIKAVKVTGKFTVAEFSVQGVTAGAQVNMAAIEALTTGGWISLPNGTTVRESERLEFESDEWKQWAPKIVGTWNGAGERDRIDEVVVESLVRGARR
jgi:hypothetical protein